MSDNPNNQPPPHLSEKNFRRFEATIAGIVTAFPNPIAVPVVAPLSAVTTAARLRDAIRSLKLYHWNTYIDLMRFFQNCDEIDVVLGSNGTVLAGDEDRVSVKADSNVLAAANFEVGSHTINSPTLDIIDAICLLHHVGFLKLPTTITNFPYNEETVLGLTQRFDVAPVLDGSTLIIY